MNNKFVDIIDKHEKEDNYENFDDSILISKIMNEFENYEEIISFINKELKVSPKYFFDLKRIEFDDKLIPIRNETIFKIRTHTKTLIPYYHDHNFYEIIYVLNGKCEQKIGKEKNELIIGKGVACLLCPGIPHLIEKNNENDIIFKLHIPKNIFLRIAPTNILDIDNYKIYDNKSEQVQHIVLRILDECNANKKYSIEAIEHYLALLLIELERDKSIPYSHILKDLDSYFESNLKNATLAEFSQLIGYNYVYVGKIIKQQTNKNFTDYFIDYKMKKAIELLMVTNKTIEEISFELGYCNVSGFYKKFSSIYGSTPMQYRNLYKK